MHGSLKQLARAGGIGALLFVASGFARSNGFDRTSLTQQQEEDSQAWFGETSTVLGPVQAASGLAALGFALGFGAEATAQLLPTPPMVSGSIWGCASWLAAERWYQRQPDRKERWLLNPPSVSLTWFVSLGAATTVLARSRYT
jgi:hypothetical protein